MKVTKQIIERLQYQEETFAGELQMYYDPVNGDYYHVPIEVIRDWDNVEIIGKDKA